MSEGINWNGKQAVARRRAAAEDHIKIGHGSLIGGLDY